MFRKNVFWKKSKHTYFMFRYYFRNRAVYEIMWYKIVQPDRSQIRGVSGK